MATFSEVPLFQPNSPGQNSYGEKEPLAVYIQEAMDDSDRGNRNTFNEPFTLISSTAETLGSASTKSILGHLSAGKDWIASRHARVHPWSEFFNIRNVNRPNGAGELTSRILGNLQRYQSNYLFVFLGLLLYCIVTNPALLFALAFCLAAWWFISIKNNSEKVRLLGRDTSAKEMYAAMILVSIPLFYFAGAGSTVFWIIGVNVVLVLAHAGMMSLHTPHKTVDEELGLVMEEVVIS